MVHLSYLKKLKDREHLVNFKDEWTMLPNVSTITEFKNVAGVYKVPHKEDEYLNIIWDERQQWLVFDGKSDLGIPFHLPLTFADFQIDSLGNEGYYIQLKNGYVGIASGYGSKYYDLQTGDPRLTDSGYIPFKKTDISISSFEDTTYAEATLATTPSQYSLESGIYESIEGIIIVTNFEPNPIDNPNTFTISGKSNIPPNEDVDWGIRTHG